MPLVKFEQPDRVEGSVGRAPEAVYELASTDRPLLAILGRLQEVGAHLTEPVRLHPDAVSENLVVVVEVEATNHSLDRSVVSFRVPPTSIGVPVYDAGRRGQPNALKLVEEVPMQPAIPANSPERRLPEPNC